MERQREGEREREDKEQEKRGDEGITGVLRSFDKIDLCKCMIGWQSVSLHLFSPRLLLIFSHTHTRVQMTPSVIRASVYTEVIYVFNNICKVKP